MIMIIDHVIDAVIGMFGVHFSGPEACFAYGEGQVSSAAKRGLVCSAGFGTT